MKSIITSLGMIVFVTALVIGGTGAFFSDTETSAGNVFTAGAIDLTVDSESHYNGSVCKLNAETTSIPDDYTWQGGVGYPVGLPCSGTWEATDLGAQTFFNFGDVKPGDEGENTISLHVDSNDAYACVDVTLTKNDDVSTVEPELEAGDTANTGSLFDGELAQNMTFLAWSDQGPNAGFGNDTKEQGEGDNIWQAGEPKLFSNTSGPAIDVLDGKSYRLADSNVGPLAGGKTSYIGLAWCAGTFIVNAPGNYSCDGGTMGNIAQTDSMEATIAFRIEQARNNPNFVCEDIPGASTDVVVKQSDLALSFGDVATDPTKWFFYNDTNDTVMTINQFLGTAGANEIVAAPVVSNGAAYMKLDTGASPRYNIATAQFGGVALSTISSLKYRIYDASASAATPFLNFNVDFNNSNVWQSRLVMVPTAVAGNLGVPANTWTDVDAINGGVAMWTWSRFAKGLDNTPATPDDGTWPDGNINEYRSWSDIMTAFPAAKTLNTGAFLGVRVGHPGPVAEESYVDWIEFDGVKYDFNN